MKKPTLTTKPIDGKEPDLELTLQDMIAVHGWLSMAFEDVTKQVHQQTTSIIRRNAADQRRLQVELVGITFLQNWLVASIKQISDALIDAGVWSEEHQAPTEERAN